MSKIRYYKNTPTHIDSVVICKQRCNIIDTAEYSRMKWVTINVACKMVRDAKLNLVSCKCGSMV